MIKNDIKKHEFIRIKWIPLSSHNFTDENELIGKEVMIKPRSRFDTNTTLNPSNTVGVVTSIFETELPIDVRWSNGYLNQYNVRDLMIKVVIM